MPANHENLIKQIKIFTLDIDKTQFSMCITIETRASSRPVFPYRADDVVNVYATALTLAAPAAMNDGDARPVRVTLPFY